MAQNMSDPVPFFEAEPSESLSIRPKGPQGPSKILKAAFSPASYFTLAGVAALALYGSGFFKPEGRRDGAPAALPIAPTAAGALFGSGFFKPEGRRDGAPAAAPTARSAPVAASNRPDVAPAVPVAERPRERRPEKRATVPVQPGPPRVQPEEVAQVEPPGEAPEPEPAAQEPATAEDQEQDEPRDEPPAAPAPRPRPRPAPAEDGAVVAARKVLEDRDLRRDGRLYLLDEADALRKYAEADQVVADFLAALAQCDAIRSLRAQAAEAQRRKAPLWEQNTDLRIVIDEVRSRNVHIRPALWNSVDRATLKTAEAAIRSNDSAINELEKTRRQLAEQLPPPNQIQAIFGEFERRAAACTSSVRDVGYAMEPIDAKYRELRADREVKDALALLSRAARSPVDLGPSQKFRAASKSYRDAKQAIEGTTRGRRRR